MRPVDRVVRQHRPRCVGRSRRQRRRKREHVAEHRLGEPFARRAITAAHCEHEKVIGVRDDPHQLLPRRHAELPYPVAAHEFPATSVLPLKLRRAKTPAGPTRQSDHTVKNPSRSRAVEPPAMPPTAVDNRRSGIQTRVAQHEPPDHALVRAPRRPEERPVAGDADALAAIVHRVEGDRKGCACVLTISPTTLGSLRPSSVGTSLGMARSTTAKALRCTGPRSSSHRFRTSKQSPGGGGAARPPPPRRNARQLNGSLAGARPMAQSPRSSAASPRSEPGAGR